VARRLRRDRKWNDERRKALYYLNRAFQSSVALLFRRKGWIYVSNEGEGFESDGHLRRPALVLSDPRRARPNGTGGCWRCPGGSDQTDAISACAVRSPDWPGTLSHSRQETGAPVDPVDRLDRHGAGRRPVAAEALVVVDFGNNRIQKFTPIQK